MNEDPGDQLSLDAAICLGNMCIPDKHGSKKLLQALQHNSNYHFKAQVTHDKLKYIVTYIILINFLASGLGDPGAPGEPFD